MTYDFRSTNHLSKNCFRLIYLVRKIVKIRDGCDTLTELYFDIDVGLSTGNVTSDLGRKRASIDILLVLDFFDGRGT